MNNLSYKLDRCCDAIEFQNSQIKALENNLISANEETKKATIVTVLVSLTFSWLKRALIHFCGTGCS